MNTGHYRVVVTVLIGFCLTLSGFALLGTAILQRGLPAPGLDYAKLAATTAQLYILTGTAAGLLLIIAAQGRGTALVVLVVSAVVGGLVEAICLVTGWPFGRYGYTQLLGPMLGGGLPVLIPLAWAAAMCAAMQLAGRLTTSPSCMVLVAALLVTLWDLVLDPAMTTGFAAWEWEQGGWYYGIPARNFLGWFGTSLLIAAIIVVLRRNWLPDPTAQGLWLYVSLGVLPAGLALLYGRGGATLLWIIGLMVFQWLLTRASRHQEEAAG